MLTHRRSLVRKKVDSQDYRPFARGGRGSRGAGRSSDVDVVGQLLCAPKAANYLAPYKNMSDAVRFGVWTRSSLDLREEFQAAAPFPHVVVEGFFDQDTFRELQRSYTEAAADFSTWVRYDNPIEKKLALTHFDQAPFAAAVFEALETTAFLGAMREISGIADLQTDPHRHGAGFHYHPRGGKLDLHLDYSIHPRTGQERRLNLIVFLSDSWDEAWGGHLELWDRHFAEQPRRVAPAPNRAILFQTSDFSYHGLPRPLRCPASVGRKSLAIYYVSPPRTGVVHRAKAVFLGLPKQPVSPGLAKLYAIRAERVLTQADLEEHFPDWKESGGEFW